MALKSIQLAHIDPIDRSKGLFTVTAHSDEDDCTATFECSSERDGVLLRNAIREHCDRLKTVFDSRTRRPRSAVSEALTDACAALAVGMTVAAKTPGSNDALATMQAALAQARKALGATP